MEKLIENHTERFAKQLDVSRPILKMQYKPFLFEMEFSD